MLDHPSPEVETFLAALDHPHKDAVLLLREIILGADLGISESIKWNAPNFRRGTAGRAPTDFATFHLRAKDGVQIILHLGTKKRAKIAVPDPDSLLEWLGPDRASVKFRDLADVQAKREAFAVVIREWIKHV